MLTPEQLETLREKWRLAVTGSQRRRYMNEGVPTLFAHIDELQYRVDFLENMYLEQRAKEEQTK